MGEQSDDKPITWAMAVEASQDKEHGDAPVASDPKKGEWVSHAKFGLCRIDLIRGDIMTIKLPTARRKQLRLDYIEFSAMRRDGDKVIYTVKAKPKK